MGYKAKSITNKASSACKMNMALVKGERAIGAVKKAGMDDLQASFNATRGEDDNASPIEMRRSPAKAIPIGAIMKAAPMIMGALGGGKKGGGGGSDTKVVVNNSANANAESNSQASNAIDPK